MSTTQHTSHYNLPTFGDNPNDRPSWRGDFTDAMTKIDNQMYTNATNITTAQNTANDAKSAAQAAQTTATTANNTANRLDSTVTKLENTVSEVESLANANKEDIAAIDANLSALHANTVPDATSLYEIIQQASKAGNSFGGMLAISRYEASKYPSPYRAFFMYSPDGINYANIGDYPFASNDAPTLFVWKNRLYVITGAPGITACTEDGEQWTQFDFMGTFNAESVGGKYWVPKLYNVGNQLYVVSGVCYKEGTFTNKTGANTPYFKIMYSPVTVAADGKLSASDWHDVPGIGDNSTTSYIDPSVVYADGNVWLACKNENTCTFEVYKGGSITSLEKYDWDTSLWGIEAPCLSAANNQVYLYGSTYAYMQTPNLAAVRNLNDLNGNAIRAMISINTTNSNRSYRWGTFRNVNIPRSIRHFHTIGVTAADMARFFPGKTGMPCSDIPMTSDGKMVYNISKMTSAELAHMAVTNDPDAHWSYQGAKQSGIDAVTLDIYGAWSNTEPIRISSAGSALTFKAGKGVYTLNNVTTFTVPNDDVLLLFPSDNVLAGGNDSMAWRPVLQSLLTKSS